MSAISPENCPQAWAHGQVFRYCGCGWTEPIADSAKAEIAVAGARYLDSTILDIAEVNSANGWYEDTRTFGEDIALLHSELSEALEGYRKNDPANVREELADVLIRLLDTWHRLELTGTDLEAEVAAKIERNRARGYRHGGKAI